VAEAVRQGGAGRLAPHLLQFSTELRPIVVWNMTNRCNLRCVHCYISAEDRRYSAELSTAQARAFIEDVAEMGCPVLLFSGGEPLLREDIFELGEYAARLGVRPVVSTNGTLITREVAERLAAAGFQYVGISIDGAEATHDRFRQAAGAFRRSVEGIKHCLAAGVKAGVRLTVNRYNVADLAQVLTMVEAEGIPRFCMYHLVYAGRGRNMAQDDIPPAESRRVMDFLIEKTLEWCRKEVEAEILTTDNHADGIYLWQYIRRHLPERAGEVVELLKLHGGCSAGKKMANVDPFGNVHPCQFWSHYTLGNIRERRFSEIWQDGAEPLLGKLRDLPAQLKGRCGRCVHKELCGGCRIRAEVVYGDVWAEDPACYLTEEEISR